MTRAGAGLSTAPDSETAALEAAENAARGLDGRRADWCLAFATPEHAPRLRQALAGICGVTGTPYVVGCSGAGVIANGMEVERSPAFGVLAVASGTIRATPFMFPGEEDLGLSAGRRVGERLRSSRGSHDLVLVWPDPFRVRPDRLLRGIGGILEGVPIAGGAAASRAPDGDTFQFCGEECGEGGVAGIRLGGVFRHRISITQGCRALGDPLRVTRSHENLIFEVDGRPALEALRDRAPSQLFEDGASPFNFLFVGLLPGPRETGARPGGYLVRNIVTADVDTGVIGIADDVEEGRYVLFVHREPQAARADLSRALSTVSAEKTGLPYRFGLYFDCLARGRSLYREDGIDAGLLRAAFPDLPILGFHCSAEIAPLAGVSHVFTYTGVLVLVAD